MNALPSDRAATWRLARLCLATFIAYLSIAIPLPVLPVFVRDTLQQSNLVVGCVIGVQFVATVLTRGLAGRIADTRGPARPCAAAACCWPRRAPPTCSPPRCPAPPCPC